MMKGGDCISSIFMKSRSSTLFKKKSRVGRVRSNSNDQSSGSQSTLSSIHTDSMTGYVGNLSPPIIIPPHVLLQKDDDSDVVSAVTHSLVVARGRRSSSHRNNGWFKTKERRRQAKKSDVGDADAGCEYKQQRRPTTRKKVKRNNNHRTSMKKRPSSASTHSTTLPSPFSSVQTAHETQSDNNVATSINITGRENSNGSAVECMFLDSFVMDTNSSCSSDSDSDSSCSSNNMDEE